MQVKSSHRSHLPDKPSKTLPIGKRAPLKTTTTNNAPQPKRKLVAPKLNAPVHAQVAHVKKTGKMPDATPVKSLPKVAHLGGSRKDADVGARRAQPKTPIVTSGSNVIEKANGHVTSVPPPCTEGPLVGFVKIVFAKDKSGHRIPQLWRLCD